MRYKLLGRSGLRVFRRGARHVTFGRARNAGQLVDNIGCVDVAVGAEGSARADTVSAIERGFPYFITGGRQSFMGKITDQVDDNRRSAV